MSTRKLFSMAASILITSASVLALLSSRPTTLPQQQPMIDGLPVTNLPGITVTAPVMSVAPKHAHRRRAVRSKASVNSGGASLLSDVTPQLAISHLRMPYYSFGSVSVQINKD